MKHQKRVWPQIRNGKPKQENAEEPKAWLVWKFVEYKYPRRMVTTWNQDSKVGSYEVWYGKMDWFI